MLYPKNQEKTLSPELFRHPTSEYRATPFWAWNCEITPELLCKEIEYMKEMGFGGFHMHPRVGLATPYLSDEFMGLIRTCVDKAKKEDMLAWLYDEDKWPSGFAGGLNTKDVENRQKCMFLTTAPYNDGTLTVEEDIANARTDKEKPGDKYFVLACFDMEFDENGYLISYRKIDLGEKAEHKKLFAYVEYATPSNWYNGETYVDVMSKPAIESFVKITHERYKEIVGDEFGKTVPSIFSDEPQMSRFGYLRSPEDNTGCTVPYTTDLNETFKATYGYSFIDKLPELIYELPNGQVSVCRYQFHDHTAERFAAAYADTIGDWCKANGIHATGHLNMEPALWTQTVCSGETMRSYRSLTLPGIDMLADHHELSTAKQCQSAARQYGREGMMSELYGVTNWCYDFKGHKQQGDWQAAFGVTVRVPHLFWVSMKGEAKRDYPASIGYQSPWYKEYGYIEDHFARVNTVMTRGKPVVNVGVIHPIESFWLHYGPLSQTDNDRTELQKRFYEIINWLVFSSQDFDLISESLLQTQYGGTDGGFTVGEEKYGAVIVPNLHTIRSSTLDALEAFAEKGGQVIFMGTVPYLVDAVPSDRAQKLAERCTAIDWSRSKLLDAVEAQREVLLSYAGGGFADNIVYNMRTDGDKRHLFVAHVNEPRDYDVSLIESYSVTLTGEWELTLMDTLTGETKPLGATYQNGNTVFPWVCGRCDSLLVEMTPGKREDGFVFTEKTFAGETWLESSVPYTLSEPNVLLLDKPAYSLNDGEIHPAKYVLDADDDIRKSLGMRLRTGGMVQPWVKPIDKNPKEKVTLWFEFESEIAYKDAMLGLESIEYSSVYLNGKPADMTPVSYYIDEEAVKTIRLPKIKKGKNTLKIDLRFGDFTQIEAYYLLGDFGVSAIGSTVKLVKRAEKLSFDDITMQTLPFYGGNITYHFHYHGSGKKTLEIRRFVGTAFSVEVDGKRVPGMLSFPPNRLPLGELSDGNHTIDITLYGNRMNTLGQLHNTILKPSYTDPGMWRPKGRFYTPDYMFREHGIMVTPVVLDEE